MGAGKSDAFQNKGLKKVEDVSEDICRGRGEFLLPIST